MSPMRPIVTAGQASRAIRLTPYQAALVGAMLEGDVVPGRSETTLEMTWGRIEWRPVRTKALIGTRPYLHVSYPAAAAFALREQARAVRSGRAGAVLAQSLRRLAARIDGRLAACPCGRTGLRASPVNRLIPRHRPAETAWARADGYCRGSGTWADEHAERDWPLLRGYP